MPLFLLAQKQEEKAEFSSAAEDQQRKTWEQAKKQAVQTTEHREETPQGTEEAPPGHQRCVPADATAAGALQEETWFVETEMLSLHIRIYCPARFH